MREKRKGDKRNLEERMRNDVIKQEESKTVNGKRFEDKLLVKR